MDIFYVSKVVYAKESVVGCLYNTVIVHRTHTRPGVHIRIDFFGGILDQNRLQIPSWEYKIHHHSNSTNSSKSKLCPLNGYRSIFMLTHKHVIENQPQFLSI